MADKKGGAAPKPPATVERGTKTVMPKYEFQTGYGSDSATGRTSDNSQPIEGLKNFQLKAG